MTNDVHAYNKIEQGYCKLNRKWVLYIVPNPINAEYADFNFNSTYVDLYTLPLFYSF